MLDIICYHEKYGILAKLKSDIIPRVGEYIKIYYDWYVVKKVQYETDGKYFENVILVVEQE